MNKNILIWLVILLIGVVLIGYSFLRNDTGEIVENSPSPTPSESASPYPTPSSATTNVPMAEASCELKGEIKFLTSSLYDNQDAKFVYKGIDHPARNIFWTTTPDDDLSVGQI